jgi:hypothetical protein
MDLGEADPKGLIRESYRIEGISLAECRSIFMDWALSIPVDAKVADAVRALIAAYGPAEPDHPMSGVLHQALTAPEIPRRRGGRTGRHSLSA